MAWLKRFWESLEWELWAAMLLALPLMLPYLRDGLPFLADSEVHLHRLISAGILQEAGFSWPRWTPWLHHGYGYPIHNFYAPGLHLLGGAVWRLGLVDAITVWKLLAFGAIMLYPSGAYLLVRTFAGRKAALVAALSFTLAPFRFHEVLLQGNLSQLAAMGLMPWVFWRTVRMTQIPSMRNVGWLAIVFGSVILIHHPTGFLLAPFGALYGFVLCMALPTYYIQTLLLTALGYIIGVGLAAVFWVPALAEYQIVRISAVQVGMFDPVANLLSVEFLLRSFWTPEDGPNFLALGQLQMALVLVGSGLLMWAWRRKSERVSQMGLQVAFGSLCLLLCIFLMIPASAKAWQVLPIANLVVFPWRLLGIAALMSIAATAFVIEIMPVRWQKLGAAVAITALWGVSVPMFRMPSEYILLSEDTPSQAILYEQRTGNMGLTSANEYLPIWVDQRPQMVDPNNHLRAEFRVDAYWPTLPEGVRLQRVMDCPAMVTCYDFSTPVDTVFMLNQMYFPGWRVTVDGAAVETRPEMIQALAAFDVPAGEHRLTMTYGGTPIQHLAEAISALCLLLCGVMIVLSPSVRHAMPYT